MPNYVDTNEMKDELAKYHNTGKMSEQLGEMFMEIAVRYTNKLYSQYNFPHSLVDDMIGESVHRMVVKIDKFDPTRENANAFAYFTQICHNQIIAYLKKERQNFKKINKFRDRWWNEISKQFNIVDNESYENNTDKSADVMYD